jgi:hypothetical protein
MQRVRRTLTVGGRSYSQGTPAILLTQSRNRLHSIALRDNIFNKISAPLPAYPPCAALANVGRDDGRVAGGILHHSQNDKVARMAAHDVASLLRIMPTTKLFESKSFAGQDSRRSLSVTDAAFFLAGQMLGAISPFRYSHAAVRL